MDRYTSWDGFYSDVFSQCGKSGELLKMLYGAGGVVILLVIVELLGFTPFLFATTMLAFLTTPVGMIVGAVFGAAAVYVLKELFSERKKLQPVLKRLIEAKPLYEKIENTYSSPTNQTRRQYIDTLFHWVMEGGDRPAS